MASRSHPFPIPTLLLGIIVLNLLFLDGWILKNILTGQSANVLGTETASTCPQACIDRINSATGGAPSSKEYYIPLGSGSGYSTNWFTLGGVQATVDTTQYRKIKDAFFEVTVQVPTGNETVWVRLYNLTDDHPVWFSEVSMNGNGPTTLTSARIMPDSGKKTYVVQMKTQLPYTAIISQARIHLLTQ